MSIHWKIIDLDNNIQIDGYIEKGENLKYNDIIISIYRKHAFHPSLIISELLQQNPSDTRLSKINSGTISNNIKQVNLFYKFNKNKITSDYNFYIPDCGI